MPRGGPIRFLRNVALVLTCMIGSWMFMPSWSISPHDRDAYIQNAFSRGRTVVTVMSYDREISKNVGSNMVSDSECTTLLLHWWLRRKASSHVLSLSSTSDEGINFTHIIEGANSAYREDVKDDPEQPWSPYFSKSVRLSDIAEGDLDEEINMRWFDPADKNLFHHEMHNFFTNIFVTGVVPEPGVVEIWGSKYINNIHELLSDPRKEHFSNATVWSKQIHQEMVLRQSKADMLASFRMVEDQHGVRFVVNEIKGRLASRSFPIRRRLLFFLGPLYSIAMIPISILAGLSDLIAPAMPFILLWLGIMFALFLYRRLVAYGFISRGRSDSNASSRKVWGPAGPVKTWSQLDEEKGVNLQRPKTVRLGKNWRD